MPDLTIEHVYVCQSVLQEHRANIKSLDNRCWYTITYGRLYNAEQARQGCEYGWTCDCPSFKLRGSCRHVDYQKSTMCFWNREMDPGLKPSEDETGMLRCPDCGRPVEVVKVAV